ncbi:MAG: DUF1800 domain-containing protein [Cyclobacteriaceae bacterium]
MSEKSFRTTQHLCNRAWFGLSPSIQKVSVSDIFSNDSATPIAVVSKPEKIQSAMSGDVKERKKIASEQNHENMRKLNIAWMEQMRTSSDPLREKMTFFWHDHFASRVQQPFLTQQQNNLLRENALGNFSDLLIAVSKDPVMLRFLNNQQNKKGHPNENFAREVMELFTIGRGHYTETDIKEAARAFTGWGTDQNDNFFFHAKQHDSDPKTFRGETKNFSGEDIISNILDDKQTAVFITKKIVSSFASPDVDEKYINDLSEFFFKSQYNIKLLLKSLFSSDWFYKKEFIGTHVKSPVELIIGIQKHTDSKFTDPESLIFFERAMNQQLFAPPNVAGWPKGKQWIDSASLAFRMSMPQRIFKKEDIQFKPKDDGDVNSVKEKKKTRDFSLDVDWQKLANQFSGDQLKVFEKVEDYLLSQPTSDQNKELILKFSSKSKNEVELTKSIFTGIMSLPEYQLC